MSKADQLRKKMEGSPSISFTPRDSVNVAPIVAEPAPKAEAPQKPATPKKLTKPQAKKAPAIDTTDLVNLFAKVPSGHKQWLDHHRVDSRKNLNILMTEAIELLAKQQGTPLK